MEIRELRAFVMTAELGGLSAAARALHVSQSALSQSVRSLERQLGVQLLVRDHAGARPTPAGAILLSEARALIERHDQAVVAVTGHARSGPAVLRIGAPLELPADLLPNALAQLTITHPGTQVEVQHASSAAQLEALRCGELDLALVRDRPVDAQLDAVLAVEEAMGVILTRDRSKVLADARGVHLHRLAGLRWIGFPRSDTPAWYDQVEATMRSHGLDVRELGDDERPITTEVKLAAVGTGTTFALAPPGWAASLPEGLTWQPLVGNPIVRRTWAVWLDTATRRDLATLVAVLDRDR